jgi:hypothetical protein
MPRPLQSRRDVRPTGRAPPRVPRFSERQRRGLLPRRTRNSLHPGCRMRKAPDLQRRLARRQSRRKRLANLYDAVPTAVRGALGSRCRGVRRTRGQHTGGRRRCRRGFRVRRAADESLLRGRFLPSWSLAGEAMWPPRPMFLAALRRCNERLLAPSKQDGWSLIRRRAVVCRSSTIHSAFAPYFSR